MKNAGLGNEPNLRVVDHVDPDDRRRSHGVHPLRGLVLLRLCLLLLHHPNDDRLRRHGGTAEGRGPGQQARVRRVHRDIHHLRPGDRHRLYQSADPALRQHE